MGNMKILVPFVNISFLVISFLVFSNFYYCIVTSTLLGCVGLRIWIYTQPNYVRLQSHTAICAIHQCYNFVFLI